MFQISDVFRVSRTTSSFHRLLVTAMVAQALTLAIGLWLEQKLADASAAQGNSRVSGVGNNPASGAAPSENRQHDDSSFTRRSPSDSTRFAFKAIVFGWICASQSVIAYLILARWNAIRDRQLATDANAYAKQNHDLIRTRDAVIFGLAKLAESRDPETGQHLERIASYARRLATAMQRHPCFSEAITPRFLKLLGISSALHDIGKVGIEDAILLKPGSLTEEERQKIQRHTLIGGECIKQIESRLGSSNFLEMAREIALYHHERWDGTGYPMRLAGEEIPLAARIIAVVDVYDALSVVRVYKKAFSHHKCVRMIFDGAGTQFDPRIVEVFLTIESEFQQCSEEMPDYHKDSFEPDSSDSSVMTPEQEQLLSRLITSEKFCTVDTLLVPVGNSETSARPISACSDKPDQLPESVALALRHLGHVG